MSRSRFQLVFVSFALPIVAVVAYACGGAPLATQEAALTSYQVAPYNAETGAIGPINTAILKPTFINGVAVQQVAIREVGPYKVLVRRGVKPDNNCLVTGTLLVPSGGSLVAAETTHSCSGVNCNGCSLATDGNGGVHCDCTGDVFGTPAYCSHTVSTTDDLAIFQTQGSGG